MSAEGAVMFARYAYPPNELGYCGPLGASEMLQADATAEIERRAREFEGAWSYLEILAECADIADPLDVRVVEAYWLGNDLLTQVDPGALVERLEDRFRGQVGGTWRKASARAQAHHSFHVFEVYPWARLLGADGNPTALSVLEQCRIRTGTVLEAGAETAVVRTQPLTWVGQMVVGPPQEEVVRWSAGGRSLIDGPAPGDLVALHWDWVCDVITADEAATVSSLEARQLHAVAPELGAVPS